MISMSGQESRRPETAADTLFRSSQASLRPSEMPMTMMPAMTRKMQTYWDGLSFSLRKILDSSAETTQ